MWRPWGITEREPRIGVTLTGLMIGGLALGFQGVAHFVSGYAHLQSNQHELINEVLQ